MKCFSPEHARSVNLIELLQQLGAQSIAQWCLCPQSEEENKYVLPECAESTDGLTQNCPLLLEDAVNHKLEGSN